MKFKGYKLVESRKKAGLTQEELAKKIGCYPADISDWEREKVKPRKGTVKKLAFELGKEINYFTGDEDEQKTNIDLSRNVAESNEEHKQTVMEYEAIVKTLCSAFEKVVRDGEGDTRRRIIEDVMDYVKKLSPEEKKWPEKETVKKQVNSI